VASCCNCRCSCAGRWLVGACGVLGIGLQLQLHLSSLVDRTNLVAVVVFVGWLVRVGSSASWASYCTCGRWLIGCRRTNLVVAVVVVG
jgi:hypothetical protein